MNNPTNCPKCESPNIYLDGSLWICPECFYEWNPSNVETKSMTNADETNTIRDANGNILANGDSVVVIKDLKVKGSSLVIKGGTKVKNIRLTDGGDGHDISCKIDGIGAMNLKSEFVRKA